MKIFLLSSFALAVGLTSIAQGQHCMPYSYYAYKNNISKKTSEQKDVALSSENELLVEQEVGCSTCPNLAYTIQTASKTAKGSENKPSEFCSENFWVEGNYLLGWTKNEKIDVPLITRGSTADTVPGAIGQPGTKVVYGNEYIHFPRSQGVRAALRGYLDRYRVFVLDINAFWMFNSEKHFSISSDASGSPLIARPYFDVRTNTQQAQLVSDPAAISGTSSAAIKSQIWGSELNLGYRPCNNHTAANFFLGVRYLRLKEKLSLTDRMTPLTTNALNFNGSAVNPPDTFSDQDLFTTSNNFYGGQFGARLNWANNWWFLDLFGKVGVGVTQETYKSQGSTVWHSNTYGDQFAAGGVLVQPNNSVDKTRTVFGWVPEVGVNVGFEPLRHLRLLVGYSFLWWNKVLRPGEQINNNVNSGQIPGNANFFTPATQKSSNDLDNQSYWLQTVNFGICFDF